MTRLNPFSRNLKKTNQSVTKVLKDNEALEKNGVKNNITNGEDEFFTDSEEETVNRNKVRGREFLKPRRKEKKTEHDKAYICTTCKESFQTETEFTQHSKSYDTDITVLAQGKFSGWRRTDPMSSPEMKQGTNLTQQIDTLCHACSLRC